MSVRSERVASLVQELMSEIILHKFPMEDFGMMTVTGVRMSPDLKIAKVYISIFGDAEKKKKTFALLEVEKKALRSELGHDLRLKFTPTIAFYLDESLDHAMRIENLLNKIHKDAPGDKE